MPPTQATLTEDEALFKEIVGSSKQFTTNGSDCGKILETEPWCSVVLSVTNVTRPEWTRLFPTAKFFLVKRNVLGQESGFQRNMLVIEQAGQWYNADSFQHLLAANGIVITDTNRELIAQAFVLTTLPDYLESQVVFSDWGTSDRPLSLPLRYNYALTAWTKIQGLKSKWFFLFLDGSFIGAEGYIEKQNEGDYIALPSETLPVSNGLQTYYFHGK